LTISQEEKIPSSQPRNRLLAAKAQKRMTFSQEEKLPSPEPKNSRLAAKAKSCNSDKNI